MLQNETCITRGMERQAERACFSLGAVSTFTTYGIHVPRIELAKYLAQNKQTLTPLCLARREANDEIKRTETLPQITCTSA